MPVETVKKHLYDSIIFQAVDPINGILRQDAFYLDELGWPVEQNNDLASLKAFCQSTMYKWAQAMEVSDAKYVLE